MIGPSSGSCFGTGLADPAEGPSGGLDADALERLMPMHLVMDANGQILRAARTLGKLRAGSGIEGRNLFDVFAVRRPRGVRDVGGLLRADGGRISLGCRDGAHVHFKAVIVPYGRGGALLNLSFGLSLVEAVQAFDLTAADFAATDLAVEMLYLVEAKSAALQESKKLNVRLQGAKNEAEVRALTDTLTGLRNRRALDLEFPRLLSDPDGFGLMHLDLDFFKDVNDTHGHAAGDSVLRNVAGILLEETRDADLVARVGGDEFILVFRNLADIRTLKSIATRIIARLEEPVAYRDTWMHISGSIGLAACVGGGCGSSARLLKMADEALYASKRNGRGRATAATEIGSAGPS